MTVVPYYRFPWFLKNKWMECTNLVDPHQLLCPWFTVVFVLFCIYTPDNHFPRPIVKQGGGLFWILSDLSYSYYFAYIPPTISSQDRLSNKAEVYFGFQRVFKRTNLAYRMYFGFSRTPTCLLMASPVFPGVCQIWFHCGKDWYLFTCFFIPTMWLKKTFHSVFSKFEKTGLAIKRHVGVRENPK
jgi:hypothetical protein